MMMRTESQGPARPGDWIVAHRPTGGPARRGEVLEVLGQGDHLHYRVRWDEEHESIFFPADGVSVERHHAVGPG